MTVILAHDTTAVRCFRWCIGAGGFAGDALGSLGDVVAASSLLVNRSVKLQIQTTRSFRACRPLFSSARRGSVPGYGSFYPIFRSTIGSHHNRVPGTW